jgi:hypothetical protein
MKVEAYVFVDTENPGPKRIVTDVRKIPGVVRADALFGTPDVIAIVEGDDIRTMAAVIDQIAEISAVLDTDALGLATEPPTRGGKAILTSRFPGWALASGKQKLVGENDHPQRRRLHPHFDRRAAHVLSVGVDLRRFFGFEAQALRLEIVYFRKAQVTA